MENYKGIDWETRHKIRTDPAMCRTMFEKILGSAVKGPTPRGYMIYMCPFSDCNGANTPHFGVKYDDDPGLWHCVRCGNKGNGFFSFCEAYDRDPKEFILGSDEKPKNFKPIKSRVEILDEVSFSSYWTWLQENSNGVSEEQRVMLLERGVEVDKTPLWFTMPDDSIVNQSIKMFGNDIAYGTYMLWRPRFEGGSSKRTDFSGEGRLVIAYPGMKYARTYLKGSEKKILGPASYPVIPYARVSPKSNYVVITEGEIKTEASWQAGVSCIGLPGILSVHEQCADIIRNLTIEKGSKLNVRIVFDREVEPKKIRFVKKANARIYDIIRERTNDLESHLHPDIEVLLLPDLGIGKVDIDSFIGFHIKATNLHKARLAWRNFVTGKYKVETEV